MSCESCQSPRSRVALFEFDEWTRRPGAVDRLVSLQDLQMTSATGCRRCYLILEAVRKRGSTGDRPVPYFDMPEQYVVGVGDVMQRSTLSYLENRYGYGSILDVLLCKRSSWIGMDYEALIKFGLHTESVETSDLLLIPYAPRVSSKVSAESYSVQIKQWLERCINAHPDKCPAAASGLPKRVIDVGNHHLRPKLYTPDVGEQGAYCALSYCWGRGTQFRTETSTIQERKRGFSLDALPKTIRDAVLLVRGLGIRYLWVDSLCIIQDSVLDWENEAAVMGDIYSRAVIVIAAVDAPHSDTGLFHEDKRRHFQRVGADHESVFVRQDFHNGVRDWTVKQPMEQLTTAALHFRGWTLQEVALALRTVWFKSGEISWSCVRSTACECRPELLDILYSHEQNSHYLLTIAYLQSSRASRLQWLEMWHRFLADYCRRKLSNVQDRLPAIAGLASKMQPHINCRYLFGFWDNETLLDRLLWHCNPGPLDHEEPLDPCRFPPCDYAPTWSWASCSIRCHWFARARMYVRIWRLEAMDIAFTTSNPFGSGRGALHLHSLIVPVTRDPKTKYRICFLGTVKDTVAFRFESEITSRLVFVLSGKPGFDFMDSRIDYADTSDWCQGRQLFFIFGRIDGAAEPCYFEGLLLERLERTEEGLHKYRRLGFVENDFAKPDNVKDSISWELLKPDTDPEVEETDHELENSSSGLGKATTNSELKQIGPDPELENFTTELEHGNPDTDSEPEGFTEPEIVFARPTWEYWQQLGKWETIVLV